MGAISARHNAMVRIEVVVGPLAGVGESPVWDVDEQRLYWVDNSRSRIFRSAADGRELSVWSFPGRVTSVAVRSGGGLVATSRTKLCTFDLDTGEVDVVFDAGAGPGFVFNDAKADRQGRFIAGLVELALVAPAARQLVDRYETAGCLHRLDADGRVERLAAGIGITNGPCFSPDGATFYCGDSWSRRIWAFDYDITTGTAGNRRLFAGVDEGDSLPDGATVDEEGFLWVATYEGGEIHRYDARRAARATSGPARAPHERHVRRRRARRAVGDHARRGGGSRPDGGGRPPGRVRVGGPRARRLRCARGPRRRLIPTSPARPSPSTAATPSPDEMQARQEIRVGYFQASMRSGTWRIWSG